MRITVFGAAGSAGSRIVREALSRGHEVTAVGRGERSDDLRAAASFRTADATDPAQVKDVAAGSDVVISATRPRPGREHELADVAAALLDGLRGTGIRLLVVGGAGDLVVPGTGTTVMQRPDFPPDWRPIALACHAQREVFRSATTDVDWTYLSPPALLEPGERRGTYRVGADELVTDSTGTSYISMEDLAVALLDEAEEQRHTRTRFTVAY
ncbi:NAD(P)H-binding protein [Nocardia sp. BSTN01]|uniref:NAD(P)-dependent oxidoreductase n=1 Tax=Nocardia sp. BSTN01 TaxID=2783665 RepID=UPI00188DECF4|nr:NAD(P)H-binding protein [Nocardia sp. BSTN01]MBF4997979.1 NAD(P)H-binding protein [Nocardia sp. BSTN01]